VPNWAFLLVRLFFSSALVALLTWIGWKLGRVEWALVAFVFSCPAIGVAVSRPLIELAHEGMTWLWRHPHQAWQGRYYEFNSRHIRVLEDEDRLWFCASDVAKACGLDLVPVALPNVRIVERLPCLAMEDIEALHATHGGDELGRFLLWARRFVVTPWERKRSGALVPR
jgi:hypothetical protein